MNPSCLTTLTIDKLQLESAHASPTNPPDGQSARYEAAIEASASSHHSTAALEMHTDEASGLWQQASASRPYGFNMAAQDAWVPGMAMDLADEGSPEAEGETQEQQLNKFKSPRDEDVALAAAEEPEGSSSSSDGLNNPQPGAGRIRCLDPACEVTFERKCDLKRHYKSKHLELRPTCPYCGQKRCRPDSLKRHILTSCKVKKALDALQAAVNQEADQEADQEGGAGGSRAGGREAAAGATE